MCAWGRRFFFFSQWITLFTVNDTSHSEEYFSQWIQGAHAQGQKICCFCLFIPFCCHFLFLFYQHLFIYLFDFWFSSIWIELFQVFFCIVTDSFFWLKYDYSPLHGLVMFRLSITAAVKPEYLSFVRECCRANAPTHQHLSFPLRRWEEGTLSLLFLASVGAVCCGYYYCSQSSMAFKGEPNQRRKAGPKT